MYQMLIEYQEQHGDTRVPQRYDENPALGYWVHRQRKLFSKKGLLPRHRDACLKAIGFVPTLSRIDHERWDIMYEKLIKYKKEHGHTLVARSYKENPQLGRWVHQQRFYYAQNKLLRKRFLLLKAIDFKWRKPKAGKIKS